MGQNILNFATFAVCLTVWIFSQTAFAGERINWYDCSKKPNGNYFHPHNCTHFVTCDYGKVWSNPCPTCHFDRVRCPKGSLVFNETRNECLWESQTKCQTCWDVNPRYCNGTSGSRPPPNKSSFNEPNKILVSLGIPSLIILLVGRRIDI